MSKLKFEIDNHTGPEIWQVFFKPDNQTSKEIELKRQYKCNLCQTLCSMSQKQNYDSL